MEARKKYFDYTDTNGAHVKSFEECGSGEREKDEKIKKVEGLGESERKILKTERKGEKGKR